MPKYSAPAQPTAEEEFGFTPPEDTPYVRFLLNRLNALESRSYKQKAEIDNLKWQAVHDQIDKEYVGAVGPQLNILKAKITALQAHSKARENAAKAQTAKWKEIAKHFAPADVVNQAELEDQMDELMLDKQGEEVQAASQNRGSEDVEMGG
jgi:hypothetical protein